MRSSHGKRFKQIVHLPFAIAECVEAHADFVEEREVKVGQRRGLRELEVSSAFHPAGGASSHEDGEVGMVVDVRVAHAAAVKVERVIQQRPIAFGRGLEAAEEFSKERDVELI